MKWNGEWIKNVLMV